MQAKRALAIIAVITVAAAIAGTSGCDRLPSYTPPRATMMLEAAPLEVDAQTLIVEWTENPDVARAKYNSKKLFFKLVTVEKAGGDGELTIWHSPLKLRAAVPGEVSKIKTGDMVNAVGIPMGVEDGKLIVSDCWIRYVDPRSAAGY